MRTKTLLLSAAALVAGALASQAQSNVYSANVVGYVSAPIGTNYTLLATPLDSGTNDLNTLLGSLPNKSLAQIWDGVSTFNSASKGGSPSVWTPNILIPPGTGFFVKLNTGATTNVFVGSVAVVNGASTTNSLPTGIFQLVGNTIPYSGSLNDTNLGLQVLPNKSIIQVWNGSSYISASKGGSPSVWSPDQTIIPAEGFFIQAHSATNWVQTLNLQ